MTSGELRQYYNDTVAKIQAALELYHTLKSVYNSFSDFYNSYSYDYDYDYDDDYSDEDYENADYSNNGESCSTAEEALRQFGAVGFDAWTANELADESFEVSEGSGLTGAHNDPQDAFRHCYWSCRMAEEIGTENAAEVGNMHEACGANPEDEREMDSHNNSIGRGFASDCEQKCLGAVNDGTLMIIDP